LPAAPAGRLLRSGRLRRGRPEITKKQGKSELAAAAALLLLCGDGEDEDWADQKVWKKADPSLGITVGIDKVKAACESARQTPGGERAAIFSVLSSVSVPIRQSLPNRSLV